MKRRVCMKRFHTHLADPKHEEQHIVHSIDDSNHRIWTGCTTGSLGQNYFKSLSLHLSVEGMNEWIWYRSVQARPRKLKPIRIPHISTSGIGNTGNALPKLHHNHNQMQTHNRSIDIYIHIYISGRMYIIRVSEMYDAYISHSLCVRAFAISAPLLEFKMHSHVCTQTENPCASFAHRKKTPQPETTPKCM